MKYLLILQSIISLTTIRPSHSFTTNVITHHHPTSTSLQMSLKPAALPLLDSGKALARGGELLIDATRTLGIYGEALSAAGANIRNAGDCVAQAAASCRFKTASELVTDELREAGTALDAASKKLKSAVEEAKRMSEEEEYSLLVGGFAGMVETTIAPVEKAGLALEAAGAGIMQRRSASDVGGKLVECGDSIEEFSERLRVLALESRRDGSEDETASLSAQRILFSAAKMKEAGGELAGTFVKEKVTGKGWIKGGM